MAEYPFPELDQPHDIHDVLTTARFRAVPDKSERVEQILAHTVCSVAVLTIQPEHGGFLTRNYLEQHHVNAESLIAFLTQKGMGELRERFTPSLAPRDAVVHVHVREKGDLLWYKVIIHHRTFDRKRLLDVLGNT